MLIATFHPTYALVRKPDVGGAFRVDLARFARLLDGTTEALPAINTAPTAANIRALALLQVPLGCDIETGPEEHGPAISGLHPNRARLRTLAFGTPSLGVSVHWATASQEVRLACAQLLANAEVTKVFHNGVHFDMPVLKRHGLPVVNWEDTRLLRRALSSTSRLSLNLLCSLYTDFPAWKEGDEGDDAKGMVETDDVEKLLYYNAQDSVVTARVWRGLNAEPLAADPITQALYLQHKGLDTVASEMYAHGFYVDHEQRARRLAALQFWQAKKEAALQKLVGIPDWKCSPNNLRALLFERYAKPGVSNWGLEDPLAPDRWTEKGDIAVNAQALVELYVEAEGTPALRRLIKLYWAVEKCKKAASTFITSTEVTDNIHPDGYLRAGWNACGTETGRWSCRGPNMQNLRQSLRSMYCASPGNVLVHADSAALEVRMLAAVTGDEVLQQRLDAGDVYTADAIDWFGLPSTTTKKTIRPGARKACKESHLSCQYRAGVQTVHKRLVKKGLEEGFEVTWALSKRLHAAFPKTYWQTAEYWDSELAFAKEHGYSETRLMKRRRYYPSEPEPSEAANYAIQGTAADLINAATLRIRARLQREVPRAALIAQCHDALDVDTPEADVTTVSNILREEMEREVTIRGHNYSFPVELKVARHWHKV